jgi:hypothetical protein
VAHKPARTAREQWPLDVWSARGSLDIRRCAHNAPSWCDRPRAPSGQMTGQCSPMVSWLSHALAQHENAGGRASEQDGDVVVDLTDARWRCRVAPLVGEPTMPQGASPRWVGAPGPAHEDGRRVRRLITDGAVITEARHGRGGLLKGGNNGGTNKMNGRDLLL